MSDSPMADAIGSVLDAAIADAPAMCIFPSAGPLGAGRRAIAKPVPKRITEPGWGGHYRLDYEGMLFSGYEWVPETEAQRRLAAWLAFQGPLVIPALYMAGYR